MSLREDHESVFRELERSLNLSIDPAVSMLAGAIQRGCKIITFGTLAEYMAHQFLTVQFHEPLACLCLNNTSNPGVFIHSGDAAVVLAPDENAQAHEFVSEARRRGAMTLGLTHAKGMRSRPDVEIRVPTTNVQRVNEANLFIIHTLLEGCKVGIRSIHAA